MEDPDTVSGLSEHAANDIANASVHTDASDVEWLTRLVIMSSDVSLSS